MLTTTKKILAIALTAACASVALTALPAAAERICVEEGYVDGVIQCTKYIETGTPGEPGDEGGNGGTVEPTCDLEGAGGTDWSDKNRGPNFCIGENVCFTTDVFAPVDMPEGEKPEEDSEAKVTWCYAGIMGPPGINRIFWSGEEEPPSLLEQAQTATAALDFTTPTVSLSPATRTLVNLDTWFWLSGAQQTVTASAFTLTAVATLRSMSVDPGDGSGSFTCTPVPTDAAAAQQSCIHEYRKASVRGTASVDGRPAYAATVTTVYDLAFTNGGAAIEIPGAPTTVDGAPATAAVRVDEVQSVVRPRR